jgi:uncharacterized membrane protein YccC
MTLLTLPAATPSLRLLTEQTARLLSGMVRVLDGLALLVDAPGRPSQSQGGYRLTVPDWLPPLVNAGRAFGIIGAVELFWIVTAWPNGAFAIIFTAIVALLLGPRGDMAYAGSLAFMLGTVAGVLCTAIIKFAVLPSFDSFPGLCLVIGLYLVPLGFGLARSRRPASFVLFTAMTVTAVPLLQPTNVMVYDTAQFYNFALSVFAGCGAASLSFRLMPPLSPAFRARRLLASALSDLRRLMIGPRPASPADWETRMYGRLAALPDKAAPIQRAELLAALAVGVQIITLRGISAVFSLAPELDTALAALAEGDSAETRQQLARLEQRLAALPDADSTAPFALRARAAILAVSEALGEHDAYFDARGPHAIH